MKNNSDINSTETWELIVRRFLAAKAPIGLEEARNTRDSYERIARGFLKIARSKSDDLPMPDDMEPSTILDFLESPVQTKNCKLTSVREGSVGEFSPPALGTQHRRLTIVIGLFEMAIYLGYANRNPAKTYRSLLRREKNTDLYGKTLSHAERIMFFEKLENYSNNVLWQSRNMAIFKLFEGTGLRLAGMASLDIQDVDLESFTLVVTEKGNKTRAVPILKSAHEPLLKWITEFRPKVLEARGVQSNALWLNRSGGRLSRRSISRLNRLVMLRCGFKKDYLGVHLLRHTFATDALEAGVDIRDLSKVMGHASIMATEIYDHASEKMTIERFRNARESGNRTDKNGGDL